ncbi:unnamed protein product [Larinioides sclopetarius]|uniref:THAP9-like helix-turn-helix domain-containing protein n=1 Tax=Larinioides sclopetarius TaxID=280406 RepID=A0AAV2BYI4_9ARAC
MELRMIQCRSSKGRRWSAKEKSFALQTYLHSPSAYRILRKYFAFPSKATLHRFQVILLLLHYKSVCRGPEN